MVDYERPRRNPRPLCICAGRGFHGQPDTSAQGASTELSRAVAVDEGSPRTRWGHDQPVSSPQMFKSFLALAALALLGAAVAALPAFAPKVEAAEAAVLAKGDRLQVRTLAANCGSQVWPNLE